MNHHTSRNAIGFCGYPAAYGGGLTYYKIMMVCRGDEYDGIEVDTFFPEGIDVISFKNGIHKIWESTSLSQN
jgi:hypothetical protein